MTKSKRKGENNEKITKTVILSLLLALFFNITSFAAEAPYTVSNVNATLYTNELTIIYADASLQSSVILSSIVPDLPIAVTGITSNGFFQIQLDATYYVPGNGLKDLSSAQPESAIVAANPNESVRQSELSLLNEQRRLNGLSEYTLNTQLSDLADQRAIETATSFSHTRPNGSSCFSLLKENNYSYRTAGENIAMGQKDVPEVVNAWMNSPGHRANILNSKFKQVGIGHYELNGYHYWTQYFSN